ncbi:MAG: RluA family pseudouridine synthase [Deltaproteobacteria bacterium]|nr:RluA family pseudouridine synthase [Deltaproteobacteria bacterium]
MQFVVEEPEVGSRLDVFLVRHLPGLGRAGARELLKSRGVRVDGHCLPRGTQLRLGQSVEILGRVPARRFSPAPAPELALAVVHEEAQFVVVDKPAGMPCHPLRPDETGTLVAALLARYPEIAQLGYARREAGLVHRLDIGTSGLVVCARTAHAFEQLTRSLRAGRWDKRYQAVVSGHPPVGARYTWPLAADPKDPTRISVADSDHAGAWQAETEVLAVKPAGSCAWVEVRASRARRHQVRVHLAHAGHALVGDTLYGGLEDRLAHHALHASALRFPHPTHGAPVDLEAPLSSPLIDLLRRLRS